MLTWHAPHWYFKVQTRFNLFINRLSVSTNLIRRKRTRAIDSTSGHVTRIQFNGPHHGAASPEQGVLRHRLVSSPHERGIRVRAIDERGRALTLVSLISPVSLISLASHVPSLDARHFLHTHQTVPSMSPEWVSATQNMRDGHAHRVAAHSDVELNPARRLRSKSSKSSKGQAIDMGGWF